MLEQILGVLESVSGVIGRALFYLEKLLNNYVFEAGEGYYALIALVAILAVGFLVRGFIRSLSKNPRTTIFFIVLFAVLAVAWYLVYRFAA